MKRNFEYILDQDLDGEKNKIDNRRNEYTSLNY
jgi:hypothetical protein